MDAKRELDEFVAIHIFDWSDFWTNGILLYGHSPGERAMGIDAERSPVPHYSTDIAAAWLVVEAMRGRGLHLQMNDTLSAYRARFFTVESTRDWDRESTDGAYYEFADTAPHAICLAALKAVGV